MSEIQQHCTVRLIKKQAFKKHLLKKSQSVFKWTSEEMYYLLLIINIYFFKLQGALRN